MAMEYVQGRTLADILRANGHVSSVQAAEIASEVRAALGFAHRNGVVHRDIKPANILIGCQRSGEGRRLRHRPGDERADREQPHAGRLRDGHRHLLLARAGAGRAARPAQRPLLAGHRAVRDGGRACRRSPARTRSASPTSRSTTRRKPLNQLVADVPRPFEAIVAKLLAKKPDVALRRRRRAARRPASVPLGRAGARARRCHRPGGGARRCGLRPERHHHDGAHPGAGGVHGGVDDRDAAHDGRAHVRRLQPARSAGAGRLRGTAEPQRPVRRARVPRRRAARRSAGSCCSTR